MRQLRALDLFCKAGGASMGLKRAGFHVTGVDIELQPNYPFFFIRGDAFKLSFDLRDYDFIWASPHCQRHTVLRSVFDSSKYPNQIPRLRKLLNASGVPYIIENVVGAPLRADLMLCANGFGLRSYRHRIFEMSGFWVQQPPHAPHVIRVNPRKKNRRGHWDAGGFVTVVGDIGRYVGPEALGIDWMTGNELSQAIPPAYSQYIGEAAMRALRPTPTLR
jgi:DNA (cytosine-5)-methyltransferase 1